MATVVLVGCLDTKGEEYAFVRDRLVDAGVQVLVVDVGVLGEPMMDADIDRSKVADAAGFELRQLAEGNDRGMAMSAMAKGASEVLAAMVSSGNVDGVMALGGTGGTALASEAFALLPLGIPKLIVSTAASGNTAPYVGESDLILVPSITDVAGLNRISTKVMANAAAAMAGMVAAAAPPQAVGSDRPMVAASMFGVTTPCVTEARRLLEDAGYEVLVFHMTGAGGRMIERLANDGWLEGVLDVTTTELADNLVGGVFSAGPERLTAAGRAGIPQVVSVGALDMVNFGPLDTVPPQFSERNLYVHNSSVTLMRTTPSECRELGRELAQKLASASGPAALFLPLAGVSAIAKAGEPFHDPIADDALFAAIRAGLKKTDVKLVELETDINDPAFADAMVTEFLSYLA